MYATAKTIEEMVMKEKTTQRMTIPPWKLRLMKTIENLRKDVNRLMAAKRDNGKLPQGVCRKYNLHNSNIDTAIERAKQRLTALSHRLQRYQARNEQYRINNLFQRNPHKVFEGLDEQKMSAKQTSPNKEEVSKYWKDIWSVSVHHKSEAAWLQNIHDDNEALPTQSSIHITEDDVKRKLNGMANWKTPGPDKVHIFWLKKLSAIHVTMAKEMNKMLTQPSLIPEWLVKGRTALIPKIPDQQLSPQDYRPITCLPNMWKVFSGILANKIMGHLNMHSILYHEQKGVRPGARGTKDQLAIDRTITKDCKNRHTNLSMAWIDYKKAYDSVPHSWILQCLKLYKVNEKIQDVISHSMNLWKTTLTLEKKEIDEIQINRGIFQGDALSPLLFCMAINPLSHILRKEGKEYITKNGSKVNHLLYMDDLKLYSKKEEGINALIRTVKIFSDDIQMKFGYAKCARLIINRGKVTQTNGLEIDGDIIRDVGSNGYKYLGIPQLNENMEKETKEKARREYTKRIRKVLKTKLNARNKIDAINMYAIPVIRYTGGAVKWTKQEIDEIHRKTRKMFTMHGALHPRADVDRIYLPRKLGGRGLVNISDAIEQEERSLSEYVYKSNNDPLLNVVKSSGIYKNHSESTEEWHKKVLDEREDRWKQKALHG